MIQNIADTETLTEVTELEQLLDDLGLSEQYGLFILNDDVNSMEHVIIALLIVCKLSREKAISVTFEAHHKGKALAKKGTKEIMVEMKEKLKTEWKLDSVVEKI